MSTMEPTTGIGVIMQTMNDIAAERQKRLGKWSQLVEQEILKVMNENKENENESNVSPVQITPQMVMGFHGEVSRVYSAIRKIAPYGDRRSDRTRDQLGNASRALIGCLGHLSDAAGAALCDRDANKHG